MVVYGAGGIDKWRCKCVYKVIVWIYILCIWLSQQICQLGTCIRYAYKCNINICFVYTVYIIYIKYGCTIDSRVDLEGVIGSNGDSVVRRERKVKDTRDPEDSERRINVDEWAISMHQLIRLCVPSTRLWRREYMSEGCIFYRAPLQSHARARQIPKSSTTRFVPHTEQSTRIP